MKGVKRQPEHARPTYFLRPKGLKLEIKNLKGVQNARAAALREAIECMENNKNVEKAINNAKALMVALKAGHKKLTIRKKMHKEILNKQKRGK